MNINDIVSLCRCQKYDSDIIFNVLKNMSEQLGINTNEIKGKRVVIKPNLLLASPPEKAATTNPEVVKAAAKLMYEMGAGNVIIAESHSGIYNEKNLKRIYEITGMNNAAAQSGAVLNEDLGWQEFSTPNGIVSKKVNIINPILNADVIINICKMKTHSLAVMTGAVKNLFGVIPGIMKFEMHARFKKPEDFFNMLIDLDEQLLKKYNVISICDGIIGMEGDGPSGGTPKKSGVLLMSRNPFNLDCISSYIMGLSGKVKINTIAAQRGFCYDDPKKIQVAGLKPDKVDCGDFIPPDTAKGEKFRFIPPFLQPRPVIDKKICRGCGTCVKNCPQHTIIMKNGKAQIDHRNCIRCYCCQELCIFKAVKIKKNFIYRFIE